MTWLSRSFLTLALVLFLASAPYAQTPALVRWASGSSSATAAVSGGPASNYTFRLPEVTQAGNALVLCVVSQDTSTTATVTDDAPGGSNTYTSVVTAVNSTDGMRVRLWVATNVKAGTRTITPAFTTTLPDRLAVTGAEFTNIALASAVDGSSSAAGSSITTMAAGSLTPTQSGDLLYHCGIRTQTPAVTAYTAGSQANITWTLQATDTLDGLVSQWGVYASTAALTPQLTMASASRSVSAAVALKAAAAGAPRPSGMQVVGIHHFSMAPAIATVSPKSLQFPTIGNLFVASIGPGGTDYQVTGITDTQSNTWTSTGAVLGDSNAGKSQRFYAQAATPSAALTLSVSMSGGNANDATVVLYDVVGAATSAFMAHYSAYNGLSGAVPDASQLTTYTNVAPGTTAGMAFAQMSVAFNTVCGEGNDHMIAPTAALCDSYAYGGESLNGPQPVDQNNGWAHYTFVTNTVQTWTWPFVTFGQISYYATTLDFFAAAPVTVVPTILRVIR